MTLFDEVLTDEDRRRARANVRRRVVLGTMRRLKILHRPPVDRRAQANEVMGKVAVQIKSGGKSMGKFLRELESAREQIGKDLVEFQKEGRKYLRRDADDY